MRKVLITGGAGYIGTTLIPLLLERGDSVTVFDNIMYQGDVLIPFFRHPRFSFIKGDVRDFKQIQTACRGMDLVIHLAAIVGYGACRKDEKLAYEVNVMGTQNVVAALTAEQTLLYASTGSNYGLLDEICTEASPLNPQSVYGKTKTLGEEIVQGTRGPFISLRFATAFGLSPRLRLDLLINELCYIALKQKYLVIYEAHFMRTFIHVFDIARSFLFAIDHQELMQGQIYNVGSQAMNLSKKDVCGIISRYTDVYIHYADYDGDADKRNYVVSYDKIRSLGFETTIAVDVGVQELLRSQQALNVSNRYTNS